jgi:hypothetical protein
MTNWEYSPLYDYRYKDFTDYFQKYDLVIIRSKAVRTFPTINRYGIIDDWDNPKYPYRQRCYITGEWIFNTTTKTTQTYYHAIKHHGIFSSYDFIVFNYTLEYRVKKIQRYWRSYQIKNKAAKIIQYYWKISISNPDYICCKRRLSWEYNKLHNNLETYISPTTQIT